MALYSYLEVILKLTVVITLTDCLSNSHSTRLVFSDITTFYKVGPGGKKDAYNRVADEDFTGPGFLYIVDNSAYCQVCI